jgi:multiple sugar transport system substrate-binding protein
MTQDPNSSKIVDQWGVVALPKGSGANAAFSAPINAGFGVGVSTGAPNKPLAYAFLEFAARPDIAARYNTVVGGIDPVRQSTLDDPNYVSFVGQEVVDAIRNAHGHAVPWPTDANWFQLQESLTDNLSLALIGEKTPQQALDDTQTDWVGMVGN